MTNADATLGQAIEDVDSKFVFAQINRAAEELGVPNAIMKLGYAVTKLQTDGDGSPEDAVERAWRAILCDPENLESMWEACGRWLTGRAHEAFQDAVLTGTTAAAGWDVEGR